MFYLLPSLAELLLGAGLLILWPLAVAAFGPRFVRRLELGPRARLVGGTLALVVFGFGYFTGISFPGWPIDELVMATACVTFWLWIAAARPLLRWLTLALWLPVIVATLADAIPWLHWQDPHRSLFHDAALFQTVPLPCGRVAELRHVYASTWEATEVTIVSHPLGGLLEREWGYRSFDDQDEIGFDGLEFVPTGTGCAVAVRARGAVVWRVD